ncbi:PSMD8 ATPase, partial [Paradoxornis webbianus]|nr:PSMD8 ATPase [Sinosuthora webbiana]NXH51404.1 PSMD8 ATPase [Rhabdornis inornatus]
QGNLFIRHPVSLEQYLMEGSYNKVFLAKGNIPAESYTFFIDILLDTIRDEIAGCIEAAYERILFPEAARILFFSSPRKMTDYAKKRGWVLGPSNYYSFGGRQQKAEDPPIPSTELATQVIEYARQLEMIV